jgi:hypothetical protein
VHEYIHAVDYEHNNQSITFGHDCENLFKTAPYIIGGIAEDIINGDVNYPILGSDIAPEFEIDNNRIINF